VDYLASVGVDPPFEKNTAKCIALDGTLYGCAPYTDRSRSQAFAVETEQIANSKRQSNDNVARTCLTRHA